MVLLLCDAAMRFVYDVPDARLPCIGASCDERDLTFGLRTHVTCEMQILAVEVLVGEENFHWAAPYSAQ